MSLRLYKTPPQTEQELMDRASTLAGITLAQLATLLGLPLPDNQTRAKGWTGQAIEHYLHSTAASLAEPDFHTLGIELKTIPVDKNSMARESTFVSIVPMSGALHMDWESSPVCKKLKRVLWVPVEAARNINFANRRIGSAFIWSPDEEQAQALQTDWEELMEIVSCGEFDKISSRQGTYLQIRPKAANAASLVSVMDIDGNATETMPRGFYLRTVFTNRLLKKHGVTHH